MTDRLMAGFRTGVEEENEDTPGWVVPGASEARGRVPYQSLGSGWLSSGVMARCQPTSVTFWEMV